MARANFTGRGQTRADQSKNGKIFAGIALVAIVLVVAGMFEYQPTLDVGSFETSVSNLRSAVSSISFDPIANSRQMMEWRTETQEACKLAVDSGKTDQKEEIEVAAMKKFQLPANVNGALPAGHHRYEYCKTTFIDLGTNIGDSIGHFVDVSLDACTPMWLEKYPRQKVNEEFPKPHVDVTELGIHNKGFGGNPLFGMLTKQMTENQASAADTCVYGMEGNPTFTERLQKLENYIMDMRPRPVKHLHIHTESVVTSTDGPTKLYLDKTSVKENFWGSSILSSQQDAQKSAKELGNGEVFSADVEGISLTSLVKNTALAYKPGATEDEKKGGLLIIKMDVEGAEYQVLKEIAASGVLCDYIKMGNKVMLIVEFHNMSITDATERRREKAGAGEAQDKLKECGVEFGKLHAFWH